MFLHHLSLANFRNYPQLELELPAPVAIFQGDNGQGKTNLLEAVYFLATTRSLRAGSDRELIEWSALQEPIPFARVSGAIRRTRGEMKVEVVIRADRAARAGTALSEGGGPAGELSKRIKINGVVKRALELIGQITVVMFSPQDLELITGSPSLRRRYLDIANCQVDPRYCRSLQHYNRIVLQRNHLLKQIREGQQPPTTLEFWNEELTREGSYLLARRQNTVAALNSRVEHYFRRLTGSGKRLRIDYRSTVDEAAGTGWGDGHGDGETRGHGEGTGDVPAHHSSLITHHSSLDVVVERQATSFKEALRRYQRREAIQAVTLLGPHRDDLTFRADGIDVSVYGSRGEQRAVTLALKLAESEFLEAATGEKPILLLDDVMSELDPSRRRLLLQTLDAAGQTLITSTDLHPFSAEFLDRASVFEIQQGSVIPDAETGS